MLSDVKVAPSPQLIQGMGFHCLLILCPFFLVSSL
jgi:hypothetical protein